MDRECSCKWRASEQARTGRWMLTWHSDTDTTADYYTTDNELMSSRRYEAAHISTRQQTGEQLGRRHAWHVRAVFMKEIKQQKWSGLQSQNSEQTGRMAPKLQEPRFVYRLWSISATLASTCVFTLRKTNTVSSCVHTTMKEMASFHSGYQKTFSEKQVVELCVFSVSVTFYSYEVNAMRNKFD